MITMGRMLELLLVALLLETLVLTAAAAVSASSSRQAQVSILSPYFGFISGNSDCIWCEVSSNCHS
jgi:hypothetical protein